MKAANRKNHRKGAALVLSMFTIAALLTLGTTFIIMSRNESRMAATDDKSNVARQLATVGVNWACSYLGYPSHWGDIQSDLSYILRNPNGGSESLDASAGASWMGRPLNFTTVSSQKWILEMSTPWVVGTAASPDYQAYIKVTVDAVVPGGAQPPQYTLTSVATLYTPGTYDPWPPAATVPPLGERTTTARIRAETALDFALFESNVRTWDLPGFNQEYAPTTNQHEIDLYNNLNGARTDPIYIPKGYKSNGDFRVDGDNNVNQVAGNLKIETGGDTSFTGRNVSIQNGKDNLYGEIKNNKFEQKTEVNDGNSKVFTNGLGKQDTRGLPKTAGYMDVRDTNGNLVNGLAGLTAGRQELKNGQSHPNGDSTKFFGYIKAETPLNGPLNVTSLPTGEGASVEYKSGESQPGVARTVITFNPPTGNQTEGTVTIQKIGAYSGKPVPDSNPLVGSTVKVSAIKDGVIYVDGGNVEVKGTVDGKVTLVAAASTDRPVTAYQKQSDGVTYKETLVTNPSTLSGVNTIFKPLDDKVFKDKDNPTIPGIDSSGRAWFPAFDPNKIPIPKDVHGNPLPDAQRVNAIEGAPLIREGNVSITGDLTKNTNAAQVGVVAQNYVFLSDQQTDDKLKVDSVLTSLKHSVQYGGFAPYRKRTSPSYRDYWDVLSGTNLPRPANSVSNGTFTLTGSIIGAFADVESSANGSGYTKQTIDHDQTLKNSLPPLFPQFERNKSKVSLKFIVLSWQDTGALKASQ